MNSDSSVGAGGFRDARLESAADIILLLDKNAQVIRAANREACERLGMSRAALEGREFAAVLGSSASSFDQSWRRLKPLGRGLVECSLLSARGGEIDVEISVSVIDSEVLLLARETATRARPEDIDANRSRKTQRTLDALDGLVVTVDPQGSILHLNQAAQALLPPESPSILGSNIARAPWWDTNEGSAGRLGESIAAALAGTRIRQTETLCDFRHQRSDYELVFSPMYDSQGDVSGLVLQGLIRGDDVFEVATQGDGESWEFDVDSGGTLLHVSQSFAKLLREELKADAVRHISDFLSDKAAEILLEQLQRLVEGELRTAEVELRGKHRPFRLILAEHPDAWDLARAVMVAESPLASRNSGNRLERVKASLLAGVSHEIRTPMNAILGLTELALSEELPSAAREHLGIALDSARHLMRLLDDILDVTRLERGRLHFEDRPFSPRRVVHQAVQAFQPSARDKGLSLTVDIADDIAPWLRGDDARIAQVVTNLVSNAVRYTDQGSIVARLRQAEEEEEEGRAKLELSVTDTGIGVDASARKRIFRPFERELSEDAKATEGLGLGLAIARRLCERMDGELSLEDVATGGSRFIATFFCALDGDTPSDTDGSEPSLDLDRAPRQLRVLVVDDAHANRHLTRTLLEQRGHEVSTENDGEAALARLMTTRPDVVLMDVSLPGIDGLEATRRIRQREAGEASPALPVIALTAHTMEGDREECLAAGMNAYLSKPVDAHELVMLVEDIAMRLPVDTEAAGDDRTADMTPTTSKDLASDYDAALKRLGGDRELLAEMVDILECEGAQLIKAIDSDEVEVSRRAAHTLKSQAATVGAETLRQRAAEIETSPSTVPVRVGDLQLLLEASVEELRRRNQP